MGMRQFVQEPDADDYLAVQRPAFQQWANIHEKTKNP